MLNSRRRIGLFGLLPILLCLPYIGKAGLRFEHLVVYGLGLVAVIDTGRLGTRISGIYPLFKILLIVVALSVLSTLIGFIYQYNTNTIVKIISGFEHYLRPVFCIVFSSWLISKADPVESLRAFRSGLLILLMINSILIVYQISTGNPTIFPAFQPPIFGLEVSAGVIVDNLWQASVEMGRYTGIFYAPMEAGVFYGIGILMLFVSSDAWRKIEWLSLPLLLLGGFTSVSKAFILVAIPLFLIGILFRYKHKGLVSIVISGLAIFVYLFDFIMKFDGIELVKHFFGFSEANVNLIERISSDRFGDSGTQVNQIFAIVFEKNKWIGLGVNPFPVMDNEILIWFSEMGFVGLFLLAVLYYFVIKLFLRKKVPIAALLVPVFIMVSALGGPVITTTKASSVFWVFIVLFSAMTEMNYKIHEHNKINI